MIAIRREGEEKVTEEPPVPTRSLGEGGCSSLGNEAGGRAAPCVGGGGHVVSVGYLSPQGGGDVGLELSKGCV